MSAAPQIALADRFWSKVNKNGPVPNHRPELGPCWLWLAYRDPEGYGRIMLVTAKGHYPEKATRVVWRLEIGKIPEKMNVCHACDNPACDNPACVRPSHLFLGTHKQNTADSISKGRFFANHIAFTDRNPVTLFHRNKTHCKQGHPYDVENTYEYPPGSGHRLCKTCRNESKKNWRHRTGRRD